MVISLLNSKEEVGFGSSVCNHHLFPAKGIPPQVENVCDDLSGPHFKSQAHALRSRALRSEITPAGPLLWWPSKYRWATLRGSSTNVKSGIQSGKEE